MDILEVMPASPKFLLRAASLPNWPHNSDFQGSRHSCKDWGVRVECGSRDSGLSDRVTMASHKQQENRKGSGLKERVPETSGFTFVVARKVPLGTWDIPVMSRS